MPKIGERFVLFLILSIFVCSVGYAQDNPSSFYNSSVHSGNISDVVIENWECVTDGNDLNITCLGDTEFFDSSFIKTLDEDFDISAENYDHIMTSFANVVSSSSREDYKTYGESEINQNDLRYDEFILQLTQDIRVRQAALGISELVIAGWADRLSRVVNKAPILLDVDKYSPRSANANHPQPVNRQPSNVKNLPIKKVGSVAIKGILRWASSIIKFYVFVDIIARAYLLYNDIDPGLSPLKDIVRGIFVNYPRDDVLDNALIRIASQKSCIHKIPLSLEKKMLCTLHL